jgi:transcriptional regulator with XRE-family HTH domain
VNGLGRGQRIARACRRGLSQAALAGLVGRSESWLSQVERGLRKVDSHTVLISLAEVLRVDVTDLTGDDMSDPQASKYAAARDIERAMMAYDSLESVIGAESSAREPDLARLRLGRVSKAASLLHGQRACPAARTGSALKSFRPCSPRPVRSRDCFHCWEPMRFACGLPGSSQAESRFR